MQGVVVSQASQALSVRDLAAQINHEYQQCAGRFVQAREHALRCGGLLAQAQVRVKEDGEEWGAWLEANTAIPPSTARLWMRYARELPQIAADEGAGANVSAISMRQAVKAIAEPSQSNEDDTDEDGGWAAGGGAGTPNPFARQLSVPWAQQTTRDLKTLRAWDHGTRSLLVKGKFPTPKELGERLSAALDAAKEPERSELRRNYAWHLQVLMETMSRK